MRTFNEVYAEKEAVRQQRVEDAIRNSGFVENNRARLRQDREAQLQKMREMSWEDTCCAAMKSGALKTRDAEFKSDTPPSEAPKKRKATKRLLLIAAVAAIAAYSIEPALNRSVDNDVFTANKIADGVYDTDTTNRFNAKLNEIAEENYDALRKLKKAQVWRDVEISRDDGQAGDANEKYIQTYAEINNVLEKNRLESIQLLGLVQPNNNARIHFLDYNDEEMKAETVHASLSAFINFMDSVREKAKDESISPRDFEKYLPEMDEYGPNVVANIAEALRTDPMSTAESVNPDSFADRLERISDVNFPNLFGG